MAYCAVRAGPTVPVAGVPPTASSSVGAVGPLVGEVGVPGGGAGHLRHWHWQNKRMFKPTLKLVVNILETCSRCLALAAQLLPADWTGAVQLQPRPAAKE